MNIENLSKTEVYQQFIDETPLGKMLRSKLKDLIELIWTNSYKRTKIDPRHPYISVTRKIIDNYPDYATLAPLWRFGNPHSDGKAYEPDEDVVYELFNTMVKMKEFEKADQ